MKVLVLGAGQLAQMMALEAVRLNVQMWAYEVGSDTVVDPITKAALDMDLNHALQIVDVVTAEFEHIPLNILQVCEASGKLKPSATAIQTGGDRRIEKQMLENAGVANANFYIVNNQQDYLTAIDKLGYPLVLKSALSGYDGKGQWRLKEQAECDKVWREIETFLAESDSAQAMVAEQFVAFDREVSLVGARDSLGNTHVYPLAENVHVDGVLALSTVIHADRALQDQAKTMFDAVAQQLNYVGVLALEFFQCGNQLLVNEIAPRVHNSGHWTQQGTACNQFENHVRAVTGLPLGDTSLQSVTSMINILGEDQVDNRLLEIPGLSLHWYGKSKRPGRKMGHINVTADDHQQLAEKLKAAAVLLDKSAFPALH